jgi:ATP-dependent 26S proteasome regulatory subunit
MVPNSYATSLKQYALAIVFIDEADAIGSKRNNSTSSGECEIQRTLLELLNQLDDFDSGGCQSYHDDE